MHTLSCSFRQFTNLIICHKGTSLIFAFYHLTVKFSVYNGLHNSNGLYNYSFYNGLYKKWFRPIFLKRSQKIFQQWSLWYKRALDMTNWTIGTLHKHFVDSRIIKNFPTVIYIYTKPFQALRNVDVQNRYVFECLQDRPILSPILN